MGERRINQAQRDRYEREREARRLLRDELHRFALWMSPVWEDDNEDDVAAALQWVDHYIEGGER